MQHRPVVNLIDWVNRRYAVGRDDRLLFVTSPSFDLSVYDLFGSLAAGASVYLASPEELHDPQALLTIIEREHISFWDSAPAFLQQLTPLLRAPGGLDATAAGVRQRRLDSVDVARTAETDLSGAAGGGAGRGDRSGDLVQQLRHRRGGPGMEQHSLWAADPERALLPAGRELRPVPYGVAGDLYIGGECLA